MPVVADHVSDDFAVGCRAENVSECLKLLSKADVILDDAIVNDDNFTIAAHVGVRIQIGRFTMRRPPGMTNPDGTFHWIGFNEFRQLFHAAGAFANADFVGVLDGDPRAVIAAVLKSAQTIDEKLWRGTKSNIADDATHAGAPSRCSK